ncbi:MAG: AMP-binding protein [Salinivirgaceae bacterium]|nr:AMP-binding protein [Salinivirgaceae bacterium]
MTLADFLKEWNNSADMVAVHTSGSTSTPKTLMVEKRRMLASARMTCDFLNLKAGDSALLCMSLDYIGAKMMVVRAIERDLRLIEVEPTGHPLANVTDTIDFAAMVPLQVYNSLQVPDERKKLMNIKNLIIGGGAIDSALQSELNGFPNAVWSTYGMTETLSHIALRRLNGPLASEWYTPLNGVSVGLSANGCLTIDAPLLSDSTLITNDIAELNREGGFRIIGRADNVINSGGVKIQIEEVERNLHDYGIDNVAVSYCADAKFGQAVVFVTTHNATDEALCQAISQLPKYWQPKRIITVDAIPMAGNGKIARKEVQKIAEQLNA